MRRCSVPGALKKACKATLLAFTLGCLHDPVQGAALENQEDPLAGFDDEVEIVVSEPISPAEASLANHFSGYTKLFAVATTTHHVPGPEYRDWHGLSGLRLEAMLEADFRVAAWKTFASVKGYYDFAYGLNGRAGYSDEVLDTYEQEVELWEAYIQGSPAGFIDLKAGRQIVVWGRSDNFRVTDVLNPLDNRGPGLVDIENSRLPLTMVKMDFFADDWNLDLISVHEHRYDLNPPFGHFFNPAARPLPDEEIPVHTLENSEVATALTGTFSGWDISFYGARVFNDQATFTPTDPTSREHRKITMFGSGSSIAQGDLLYIVELAHFRGLRFMNDYEEEYNRTDFLTGIEYSGWPDTIVSLDYVNRHLHDYDAALETSPEGPRQNDNATAVRITSDFMQDTLQLTALLILNGELGRRGAMQRFTAKYDIADNWSASGGFLLFQARDGAMAASGDSGRVFCELRYDF